MTGSSVGSPLARDAAPAQVPVYPVVRLELRQDCDQWVAVLNGELVGRCGDEEGQGVARALLVDAAALVASQRPGGAIRARLGAGFEPDEAGVVTAGGRLIVQEDVAAPATRRGPRRVLFLGVVAVVTAAVTAAGVVVHSAHPFAGSPRVATASPTPSAVQLPVLPPVGWSSVAAWSLPLSAQSATTGIAADARMVFAATPAGDGVVGVDAGSGVRRWSASVGAPVVGGPILARPGEGSPVVVVWTRDHLFTLDPVTGAERGSWVLDTSLGQVGVVGGGVVVTGQGQHAQVFDGSRLVSRVVPAGGSVVGVYDGAMVVAGNGAGWLVTSASVAGEGAVLSPPAGTTWAGPVGVVDDHLLCAFSSPDGSGVLLRAFKVGTWDPLWTTAPLSGGEGFSSGAISGMTGSSPSLFVAPDSSWGIAGRIVIDFHTGVTHALPSDWTTSTVGRAVGFGTTTGRVVSVTAQGVITGAAATPTSPAPTGTSVGPAAVTDAGEALIVATDGTTRGVYAVPRQVSRQGRS